jgi:hypothetical protein
MNADLRLRSEGWRGWRECARHQSQPCLAEDFPGGWAGFHRTDVASRSTAARAAPEWRGVRDGKQPAIRRFPDFTPAFTAPQVSP